MHFFSKVTKVDFDQCKKMLPARYIRLKIAAIMFNPLPFLEATSLKYLHVHSRVSQLFCFFFKFYCMLICTFGDFERLFQLQERVKSTIVTKLSTYFVHRFSFSLTLTSILLLEFLKMFLRFVYCIPIICLQFLCT